MNANKPPILPSVVGSTAIQFHGNVMYWVDKDGVKHKIVKAGIVANGVRDLCIYWKGPRAGDIGIGKMAEVAKEHILWIPKGDILWMMFTPPLGDRHSLYADIRSDPKWKDVVKEMMQIFKGEKGPDFDMYGGEEYL